MIDVTLSISMRIAHAVDLRSVAMLILAGLSFACSSEKETTNELENFPIIRPTLVDTVFAREYVADIQSIQNVELRARVSGFIEKIHVDEGQQVKARQFLFSISSQVFRDDLHKANAALKSALADAKLTEVELANTRKLVEGDVVSHSELEMAEAKLEAVEALIEEARSAVSTAQLNLSFTAIKAPFDGMINRIPNKTGSLIDEGTLLTTISNNTEVFGYFNVSEIEYLEYVRSKNMHKGKEVSLIMADNQPYNYKGKIETVESEINKNTGTIAFRARFPNPAQLLKHGASGKVLLTTEVKNALLIPQKSTFEIQENTYVYVVDSDNTVQMRRIIPSVRLPHFFAVGSGLCPSDRLIYEGIQRVREGQKIIPENIHAVSSSDN